MHDNKLNSRKRRVIDICLVNKGLLSIFPIDNLTQINAIKITISIDFSFNPIRVNLLKKKKYEKSSRRKIVSK